MPTGRSDPAEVVLDEAALVAAHKAVEDVLIDFRDRGISVFARNGFVVRQYDGRDSHVIRLSTRDGLAIGIRAYLEAAGQGPGVGGR